MIDIIHQSTNSNTIIFESDENICFRINKHLHRYQKIDEKLYSSLKNNYQWFSHPLDFNDPYDCNIELEYGNNTPYEVENFCIEIDNRGSSSKQSLNEIIKYFVDNSDEISNVMKTHDAESVSKKRICCFSEKDDSLLMWSHYADNHEGVCLSFDFTKDLDFFDVPYCVEYLERYPKINFIKDWSIIKVFRIQLATKSKEWEYEKEIRIIKVYDRQPYKQDINFKKEALSSIKFGYKSLEIEQIKIKSILEKVGGYEHVKFYKAKLKRFEFGMEYEEIFI